MDRNVVVLLLCLVCFPLSVGAVPSETVENKSASRNWTLVHQTDDGERWYVDKEGATFLPGPMVRIRAKQDRGRNYRLLRYESDCGRGVYRLVEFYNHLYDGSLHNALETPEAPWISLSPGDTPERAVLKAACSLQEPVGLPPAVSR